MLVDKYWKLGAIILIALPAVKCDEDTNNDKFRTDCFTNDDTGTCESSRVKINDHFYVCDFSKTFENPVKRISVIKDDVLIFVDRNTYLIDEKTNHASLIRRIAPRLTEVIDKNGNMFTSGQSPIFVKESKTQSLFEIETTEHDSDNDLALDGEANKLLILSKFYDEDAHQLTSKLFVISTDPLDTNNEMIKAQEVENIKDVTSIAFQKNTGHLLVGVKDNTGDGKYIKLKSQSTDPCSVVASQKTAIVKVITEFKDKIIKTIENSTESTPLIEKTQKILQKLQEDNKQLSHELFVATRRLNITNARQYSSERSNSAISGSLGYSGGSGFGGQGSGGIGYSNSAFGAGFGSGGGFGGGISGGPPKIVSDSFAQQQHFYNLPNPEYPTPIFRNPSPFYSSDFQSQNSKKSPHVLIYIASEGENNNLRVENPFNNFIPTTPPNLPFYPFPHSPIPPFPTELSTQPPIIPGKVQYSDEYDEEYGDIYPQVFNNARFSNDTTPDLINSTKNISTLLLSQGSSNHKNKGKKTFHSDRKTLSNITFPLLSNPRPSKNYETNLNVSSGEIKVETEKKNVSEVSNLKTKITMLESREKFIFEKLSKLIYGFQSVIGDLMSTQDSKDYK